VDSGLRGNPGLVAGQQQRYQDLTAEFLRGFGSIIHLAGHNSVVACDRWPTEAFANNVAGFVDLVHKLSGQKLVFASSISIYVNTAGRQAAETDPLPDPVSFYDLHKQLIERYARVAYPNSYGLRFGTVCGPAPNLRTELLLNALVRSAVQDGYVQVANRDAHRPLLGIFDLCRAIEAIVTGGSIPPGVYNLASVNARIGEVADYVAHRFCVACREVERENKYDVLVSNQKFREASGMAFRDDVPGLVEALHTFFCPASAVRSSPRAV
jgi:nucleoside-diphosphate-sugar epimerase